MSRYVRPSGDGPEYTDVLKAQVERLTAEIERLKADAIEMRLVHGEMLREARAKVESLKNDLGRAIDGGVDNRCEVLELERKIAEYQSVGRPVAIDAAMKEAKP